MSGLTESVYTVLFHATDHLTVAAIKERVPASVRKSVDALVSDKFKSGVLVRSGAPKNFVYQLSEDVRQHFTENGVSLNDGRSRKQPSPERADRLVVSAITGTDGLTLNEVEERCDTLLRHQVVSSVNELVAMGILKSEKLHGTIYYTIADQKAAAPDAVAIALQRGPLKPGLPMRIDEIELELAELQAQLVKDKAGSTAIYHASAARQSLHVLKAYV